MSRWNKSAKPQPGHCQARHCSRPAHFKLSCYCMIDGHHVSETGFGSAIFFCADQRECADDVAAQVRERLTAPEQGSLL